MAYQARSMALRAATRCATQRWLVQSAAGLHSCHTAGRCRAQHSSPFLSPPTGRPRGYLYGCTSWGAVQRAARFCDQADATPQQAIELEPLKVVLDIDECLVHSTAFTYEPEGGFRQDEDRPSAPRSPAAKDSMASVKDPNYIETFTLSLNAGSQCTVYKRHGLDDFLRACAEEFEVMTYTAGKQVYAEPLLDHLDPDGSLFSRRLYRGDCREVMVPDVGAQYLKDLSMISPELQRVVLVDNNPLSFVCQPTNGIPVNDFYGEPDDQLDIVLALLRKLQYVEDVRPWLTKLFNLDEKLAYAQQQLLSEESA